MFENDVKKYGTQTFTGAWLMRLEFENDVKKYGTQTNNVRRLSTTPPVNDVKKYGTQTVRFGEALRLCLRMM